MHDETKQACSIYLKLKSAGNCVSFLISIIKLQTPCNCKSSRARNFAELQLVDFWITLLSTPPLHFLVKHFLTRFIFWSSQELKQRLSGENLLLPDERDLSQWWERIRKSGPATQSRVTWNKRGSHKRINRPSPVGRSTSSVMTTTTMPWWALRIASNSFLNLMATSKSSQKRVYMVAG